MLESTLDTETGPLDPNTKQPKPVETISAYNPVKKEWTVLAKIILSSPVNQQVFNRVVPK
ncbi:MAG: hypothetical protein F6K39_44035 [Okeania sp. SIO3B3]|nr:hypothetical protein [Okeania sp. SIO3B3]